MKLTRKKDPEAIKRYDHLPRAHFWRARCSHRCPGAAPTCTLETGHRGPHAAHAFLGNVVAVWDEGTEIALSRQQARSPPRVRRRTDFDDGWAVAKLKHIKSGLSPSSPEDLALLVFFLAFVVFAIRWALLIMA